MVDLSTQYLGLSLANPLVPSASPFSKNLDSAKKLEDAGAAALVMHSMFEEKVLAEEEQLMRFVHQQSYGYGEANSFHPIPDDYITYQEKYLNQLQALKSSLNIPIIASLNGTTPTGWLDYGLMMAEAGADALELNIYYIPTELEETSQLVEDRYVDVLCALRSHINIPITVKLSSQFSALVPFTKRLEQAGADGIVLFNRFYQPDINLETLMIEPSIHLSDPQEALLRIRWTAILADYLTASIAVTGGIHSHEDMLKALLAGADVTHMCSALLHFGEQHITQTLTALTQWLEEHEYESIGQLKGSLSRAKASDAGIYERTNYVQILDSVRSVDGVWG
ncbi:dihydroorotate dehydrogenase-like protein [Maribrevibacterium harenarium]|uniref:Dihydroorotate dehydrogenase-like protein n=1 Tax=Maribrevibacterium harenarium TaxID=2589817 RepID=A0A501WPX3_9GAMM|nr:dihydroorotate dehydrogenase-like protein [Maribrevibacterium harenarium]TPE51833.1 dihydroorotate dehydrogenase-like protein [Maribrevibacterium harenarium]